MSTNQAGSPEVGSAQGSEAAQQEYTLVQDASIDDLDAYLSLPDEEASTYTHDSDPQLGQPENKPRESQQSVGQPNSPEISQMKAELEALRAERAHLMAANSESQKFIGRQSSEIGELRKQLKQKSAELQAGLSEKMVENPVQALRDFQEIQENERAIEQLNEVESATQKRSQVLAVVKDQIPEDVSIDDMALVMQRDGFPADAIEAFKKDPIAFTRYDAVSLSLLGKRAAEQRAIVTLGYAYQQARQKIEDLEAKLKAVPTSMLQRLHNATRESKGVAGGNVSSTSRREFDIEKMSAENLEQLLRQPG